MGDEDLYDGFPTLLEGLDALFELCILPLARLLTFLLIGTGVMPDVCSLECREGQASAKLLVLLLELRDTTLESTELRFTLVTGVLCGDAV